MQTHDRAIEAAERLAMKHWLYSMGRYDLIDFRRTPSANDRMMRAVQGLVGIVRLNDIIARAQERVAAQRAGQPMPDFITT